MAKVYFKPALQLREINGNVAKLKFSNSNIIKMNIVEDLGDTIRLQHVNTFLKGDAIYEVPKELNKWLTYKLI